MGRPPPSLILPRICFRPSDAAMRGARSKNVGIGIGIGIKIGIGSHTTAISIVNPIPITTPDVLCLIATRYCVS